MRPAPKMPGPYQIHEDGTDYTAEYELVRFLFDTSPEHWRTFQKYARSTDSSIRFWRRLALAQAALILVFAVIRIFR